MNWASDVDGGNVDEEILKTLTSKVRSDRRKSTKRDPRLQRTIRYHDPLLRSMHVFV